MPRAAPVINTTLSSSVCLIASTYRPGTDRYRRLNGKGASVLAVRRRGGARRAAREAAQHAGLLAGEAVRPAARLHEQLADVFALRGREHAPARLQPDVDDHRAAPQLRPGDVLGAREVPAA